MNVLLIIGSPRSGTSIVGELFAASRDVSYVFEAHDLWWLGGRGVDGCDRLEAQHATPSVVRQIRKELARMKGERNLLVEKCPRNTVRVPYLEAVVPEAKLVHVVRDGRDVACSLMPGIGGQHWRHVKPPSWRRLYETEVGIRRCALAWRETVEIALGDLENRSHFQLRFEDFLAQPASVGRELAEWAGVEFTNELRQHTKRVQDSTVCSYHAAKQVRWYRDDHKTRVGRWLEGLTPAQQIEITQLLSQTLCRLGYDPSPPTDHSS